MKRCPPMRTVKTLPSWTIGLKSGPSGTDSAMPRCATGRSPNGCRLSHTHIPQAAGTHLDDHDPDSVAATLHASPCRPLHPRSSLSIFI